MIDNPLAEEMPAEVPIAHPPLVRVLAQLRFPVQPEFEQRDAIAPIFEALSTRFPVVREEPIQGLLFKMDPAVSSETKSWTIWRLSDVAGQWRISLARDFLALETTAYQNHADFIQCFQDVLSAFPKNSRPAVTDRFGLRYVDRLTKPALLHIDELIRPELLGVLASPASARTRQSFAESICDVTPHTLIARYGSLPPNASYDPGTLVPIAEPSWILDLDMYREHTRAFDIDQLSEDAKLYAAQIYTFFRWAVTDKFLAYFNEHEK
jgi:uncharacterized protein (TIGR04255 family)